MENKLNKEQLYIKFHDKVVRYFSYHLNDDIKADDLAEDVFVKALEKYDLFEPTKSSISTWIYAICHNILVDYYRSNEQHLEYIDELYSDDCEEDYAKEDELEKLANSIEKLSKKERTIIVDHYYNNISLKDIALNMGISYVYTKVLHAKALRKLKEIL